jgi:hypothetical protein
MKYDLTGSKFPQKMKPRPITEATIQRQLYDFYSGLGHKLIAPNIYLHYSEADLITVQASGYVNEIEIKITKADFKRDFEKRKHKYYTAARAKKVVRSFAHIPNYFWFAFPEPLLDKIDFDVPDYYGLIAIKDLGHGLGAPNIHRRAKFLHKKKITDKQVRQIARSLMFKMWKYSDPSFWVAK